MGRGRAGGHLRRAPDVLFRVRVLERRHHARDVARLGGLDRNPLEAAIGEDLGGAAFLDRIAGYPPLDYFKHLGNFNAPELDLLNVRYLAGEPGWKAPGEKWKPVYDGRDGVVFENSSVTWPSQPGSSGVTLTMMPQRA